MVTRKDGLLVVGLLLLVAGLLVYFDPFHAEPIWMAWIFGPVLMYLGLPFTMIGIAIRLFGDTHKQDAPLPR
jgi:hypothetical protein